MFRPSCLPILIGSLPLTDHEEATRLVLTHTPEIPLWPQLPKLPREGMIRQFINGLPGLTEDGDHFWLDKDHDRFAEEMALFYQDYLQEIENLPISPGSRFALTPETAQGFFTFIQALEKNSLMPLTVKGQVTGPMTTGIGVKDQHGNSIFYDDNIRDIVVKLISMKAHWQVEQLKPYTKTIPPIIFIDEPGIVSFGSTAYTSVTREMVTDSVREVIDGIKSAGGLAGVHICANGDWAPVLNSNADLISFDAYSYFDNFILYKQPLINFIKRGGILVWGIIPTGDLLAVENESLDSLFSRWEQQREEMVKLGIPQKNLLEQTLIAPSCGTGSLTVTQATKVLYLTGELSKKIRKYYRVPTQDTM